MAGTLGVIGGSILGPGTGGGSVSLVSWVEGPTGGACTTSATAHVKGSWATLIASTGAAANMIVIAVSSNAISTDAATLLDIGIGAASSEVVLVPDIACGGATTSGATIWSIAIPIAVAAGTRLAIRAQGARVSSSINVTATLYAGAPVSGTTAAALGTVSGSSSGTEVGTAWTEIVASTATDYDALVVCPSLSTATASTSNAAVVIGTGAAGAEVEVEQIPVSTNTAEFLSAPGSMFGWQLVSIIPGVPAGTRIVAKRTVACDVSFIGIS